MAGLGLLNWSYESVYKTNSVGKSKEEKTRVHGITGDEDIGINGIVFKCIVSL